MPRFFYRSLPAQEPRPDDYTSYAALGRVPKRTDPDFLRQWGGVSVYDTYRRARKNAKGTNWRIGAYIAELCIPDGALVTLEGPSASGHWNIYNATPEMLESSA